MRICVCSRGRGIGFTLIELLVVVAILSLLMSLLLPSLRAAREAAKEVRCAANLKTIGNAMQMYAMRWNGAMVPAQICYWRQRDSAAYNNSMWFLNIRPDTGYATQPWRTSWTILTSDATLHGPFRCPSANMKPQWMTNWAYFGVTYQACTRVHVNNFSQNIIPQPIMLDRIPSPAKQMSLAEDELFAGPDWNTINGDSANVSVNGVRTTNNNANWGSDAPIPGLGMYAGKIVYQHGKRNRTNVLMADGGVRAGVTRSEGRQQHYQNPESTQMGPP